MGKIVFSGTMRVVQKTKPHPEKRAIAGDLGDEQTVCKKGS